MTSSYVSERSFPDEAGQWWHATYAPDGTETSRTETTELAYVDPEPEPPTALDMLATMPADQLATALATVAALTDRRPELLAAIDAIAPANTAKAAVTIVGAALTAAVEATKPTTKET